MFHRRTARRCFNSQPPEGGCTHSIDLMRNIVAVSTHSRSKAAALCRHHRQHRMAVSTHSRSKAAARWCGIWRRCMYRFNSQPLEGGCSLATSEKIFDCAVSTHSRSKAAAQGFPRAGCPGNVSTHSRSKAAADVIGHGLSLGHVSTHSRSKAAACRRYRLPP